MKIIGVTGGVGSGKSEVLRFLEREYKAYVCQLDEVAKALQRRGTACFKKIVECFGEDMVGEDGELDRAKLGQAVFGSAEKLNALNAIVHPEVKRWVRSDIERKKETQVPLYVIEAALLLEAGYQDICDELWYIFVPQDIRRERLKVSRGYSDERIDKMFASQLTDEAFQDGCTVVIDNGGTFENTIRQIGDRL